MNGLLNKMQMNLEIAGFSPKTQDDYMWHVKGFHNHFDKQLESLGYDEVREFLHYAITQRKLSCSYVNQAYSEVMSTALLPVTACHWMAGSGLIPGKNSFFKMNASRTRILGRGKVHTSQCHNIILDLLLFFVVLFYWLSYK